MQREDNEPLECGQGVEIGFAIYNPRAEPLKRQNLGLQEA